MKNFFMWAVLYSKLIVSVLNFSEKFSRVSINCSYVGDKIQSRQPSCNKWYHLKNMKLWLSYFKVPDFMLSWRVHKSGGCGRVCVPYLRLLTGRGGTLLWKLLEVILLLHRGGCGKVWYTAATWVERRSLQVFLIAALSYAPDRVC